MDFKTKLLYNSNKEMIFLCKPKLTLTKKANLSLNEDATYVPRFTIKNDEIFPDFPTNTPMKFSVELMQKAIEYGMILQIDYKGAEDEHFSGHERTIYPMVYGKSKMNKGLLRGFHLKGWSVSGGGDIDKEWRMFRTDRILNVVFTGSFFRLAPDGYNPDGDKGIQSIIHQTNFDTIRKNQTTLLNKNEIDQQDRVILNKIKNVETKDLNYNLKVFKPWEGNLLPKKDAKNIRITFAKPLIGNGQWVAIIGTSIVAGNIFKLKINDKIESSYKSVKWIMGDELDKLNTIEQQSEFKALLFLKGN